MSLVWIRRIVVIVACLDVLLVGALIAHRQASGDLRVTFLDVGQGDAAVIESPSGKVCLIDTGGVDLDGRDDRGRRVVLPFLRSRGINRVDVLVLTHSDSDHTGGAASILSRIPVGLVLENGVPTSSPVVTRLLTEAKHHEDPCRNVRRGAQVDFGDGAVCDILAPSPDEVRAGEDNDASVVIRLQYGRTRVLFMGDAERGEESELIRSGQSLACDVLKVGHHGSDTSTSPDFLDAARPKCAVVSVGARNPFGHPSPRVIERLKAVGARIYTTESNGAVTATSDGISIQVTSQSRGR